MWPPFTVSEVRENSWASLLKSARPLLCSQGCLYNDYIDLNPGWIQPAICTTQVQGLGAGGYWSVTPSTCPGFFSPNCWLTLCVLNLFRLLFETFAVSGDPWPMTMGQKTWSIWWGEVYGKASSSAWGQKNLECWVTQMTYTSYDPYLLSLLHWSLKSGKFILMFPCGIWITNTAKKKGNTLF